MRSLLAAALLAAFAAPCRADVKLPTVFGDHMVLQRDKKLVVWGWAGLGEKVSVTFSGVTENVAADAKGAWAVELPASKANDKGQELVVKGEKNTVTIKDVLVGDVWVGSGQSNMEWSLRISGDAKENIAAADHPLIRLYHVPKVKAPKPEKDIKAAWKTCTPKNVPEFSAALYHFGVALQKELKVPIGLVNSSWGGSRIQPWTVSDPDPKDKEYGQMYNAMIAPLRDFRVKGVIWYQGESNVGEAMRYRDRKEKLIKDWRRFWGDDLPFYFVQIAPFTYGGDAEMLPKFWEAQTACLKIPGTGMAVVTDAVHNVGDIHPRDKKTVGDRLALWALAKAYGKKDVAYSGPLFKGAKFDGGKAVVSFAHAAGGLKARDGKALTTFELAGEDGKWHVAEAAIEGETVAVTSKAVAAPVNVRFGWSKTANPNLINKEGLPAGPFRSKDWQGGTGE
ncbi:MAG: sialate O-acetylesterase [Gemmataceae bacterium]|nr:sialate O-acetylesterase [Gemmataceae bacterium]